MSGVDTSAEAVERLAAWHDNEAGAWAADGGNVVLAKIHRLHAATLRALAAERDAARADEREACARIANERGAWASNDADADSLVDRLEANGRMDMAKEIAAAIRARSTP
jgi:hypothetical protein